MDKQDTIILEGVLMKFPKCTHDGRIYSKELYEGLIREYEIELRNKKIKRILNNI